MTSLEEVLKEVQARRLILQDHGRTVRIWAPNQQVPGTLVRALRENRQTVLSMIGESDIRVCPSVPWHRSEWYYCGAGRYRCGVCERLLKEVS